MMGAKPLRVPIFPLSGAILFPRAQLPLHIFEERYCDMVRDAMAGAGQVAMIQPAGDGDHPSLFKVGCLGEIVGVEEMDDGRYNIVLHGSHRFRLIAEPDVPTLYRQADIDIAAFDDSDPEPLSIALRADVEQEARRFGDSLGLTVDWESVSRLDDELLVNAIAQVAPFDAGAKQALLESDTLIDRAHLVVQLMQFMRAALGSTTAGHSMQ